VIRRGVLALVVLMPLVACSGGSSAPPDSEAAIALLPDDARGPFPLVDSSGLPHGWVAVSPNSDRSDVAKTFEDHGVDFAHGGATDGGWVAVEDDDTAVRIVFDTRAASASSGAACVDRVESDPGTPRTAVTTRTDALGMVHFVVQHGQWRGGPAAYVSVGLDDGSRLILNAITVDDGSLVLVSTCD
jgi:hypothetical protein